MMHGDVTLLPMKKCGRPVLLEKVLDRSAEVPCESQRWRWRCLSENFNGRCKRDPDTCILYNATGRDLLSLILNWDQAGIKIVPSST